MRKKDSARSENEGHHIQQGERREMTWDKARLALVIMGGVVCLELLIIGALGCISIYTGNPVAADVWEILRFIFYTTLTGLIGVAGAQALNGRTKIVGKGG